MQSSEASTSSEVETSTLNNEENHLPSITMDKRLHLTSPYNIFFNTIPESSPTLEQTNSVTFKVLDLLCLSLGELSCSLQIAYYVDLVWLMQQYQEAGLRSNPLTVLYGNILGGERETRNNVTKVYVKCKDPFGVHHSKIGMYVYNDKSVRIVVSTANLSFHDWNHYCQGVFFISSTPGYHDKSSNHNHLQQVGSILSTNCTLPPEITAQSEGSLAWEIISQSSSIGSLGETPEAWLRTALLRSLASHNADPLPANSNANLKVIFPTQNNVLGSYYGQFGGDCLLYRKVTDEKQKWLKDYLHCWKADDTTRSRAMPHIKTYCRISPCLTQLAWFLLTSANISRAAWGDKNNTGETSYLRSYEAGVLFIPKFFDEIYFKIKGNDETLFPFIYDLPLTSYRSDDYPWCN